MVRGTLLIQGPAASSGARRSMLTASLPARGARGGARPTTHAAATRIHRRVVIMPRRCRVFPDELSRSCEFSRDSLSGVGRLVGKPPEIVVEHAHAVRRCLGGHRHPEVGARARHQIGPQPAHGLPDEAFAVNRIDEKADPLDRVAAAIVDGAVDDTLSTVLAETGFDLEHRLPLRDEWRQRRGRSWLWAQYQRQGQRRDAGSHIPPRRISYSNTATR